MSSAVKARKAPGVMVPLTVAVVKPSPGSLSTRPRKKACPSLTSTSASALLNTDPPATDSSRSPACASLPAIRYRPTACTVRPKSIVTLSPR